MIRPTVIDLNPVELNYYPFMVGLDKYSESWNSVDDLSGKICVPNKTNDVNVKACDMVTNKNETTTMLKHISCDCKWKYNSTACSSNRKLNNDISQCECKSYRKCRKNIVRTLAHVFAKLASI